MVQYRDYSYEQTRLLAVSLKQQIQPHTFEYTINYLVDHHIELSVFEAKHQNDETGAPAIDPVEGYPVRLLAGNPEQPYDCSVL